MWTTSFPKQPTDGAVSVTMHPPATALMTPLRHALPAALIAASLLTLTPPANALIRTDTLSTEEEDAWLSKNAGAGAELFLLLMDQGPAKLSYTLDLGLDVTTFKTAAQADGGYSFYKTLSATAGSDPAFAAFIASASLTTMRWAVLGASATSFGKDNELFITLTNNGQVSSQTANFDRIKGQNGLTLTDAVGRLGNYIGSVNGANAESATSTTHNTKTEGSALAQGSAGHNTYTNAVTGFNAYGVSSSDGDCLSFSYCVGNPLGVSSWFYSLKPRVDDDAVADTDPNLLNEFDNLGSDGYWGFAKNQTTGDYLLSYTLAAATPQTLASTDFGRTRLSFTDYSASAGMARLITIGSDDVANAGFPLAASVTAVPEPQTWGLMALGGLLLAARVRRERRA